MFKNKLLKTSVLTAFILFAVARTSYAAGWEEVEGAWKYQKADGTYASNTWVTSGEDSYYIGSDEKTLSSTIVEDGDNLYYVDESGKMVKDKWISFDDDSNNQVWYYFGSNGRALKGKGDRVTPKTIDQKQYIFDTDGKLKTGFLNEAGEVIDGDDSYKFLTATYYAGEDGALYTDKWLLYPDVGETGARSELAQRNYNDYAEIWLYFDYKGKKLKAGNTLSPKLKEINGATYSFDENGAMIPGLALTNYTGNATASNAGIRYGSDDNDGAQKSDSWVFTVPNEAMSQEEYDTREYSWFRTRKNGSVIKDQIATVNGRKYAFDQIGRMITSFVIMHDDGKFGIKYEVNEWNRKDFLTNATDSPIDFIERGNLYLFGADELNDGSMIRGEATVALRDGDAVFGFRNSGVAIGNKCKLEKSNGKFYFNGLRIDANADIKYGILRDTRNGSTGDDYLVVDSIGRVITGTKVIKDGEDNWIVIKNSKFVARVSDTDKPRKKGNSFYHYNSDAPKGSQWGDEITFDADGIDNLGDGFVLYK